MQLQTKNLSQQDMVSLLRQRGIHPTLQRVAVAKALFEHGAHMAAEDLFRSLKDKGVRVSKATVYNTLGTLAERGVIREVIADPNRVFYDPNTAPHHHFYNEVSGELIDVDAKEVRVTGLPALPEDSELLGVDVIIRVRPRSETGSVG